MHCESLSLSWVSMISRARTRTGSRSHPIQARPVFSALATSPTAVSLAIFSLQLDSCSLCCTCTTGFAASQSQLCDHCNPANDTLVAPCCVSDNTALAACGYTLTAANIIGHNVTFSTASAFPTSSSVASATATAAPLHRLSNGAVAGAIVGSIVGTLLLVLVLFGIWFVLRRRRKNQRYARRESGTVGTVGSTHTLYEKGGVSGTGSLNDGTTPRPFLSPVFGYVLQFEQISELTA